MPLSFGKRIGDLTSTPNVASGDEFEVSLQGSAGSRRITVLALLVSLAALFGYFALQPGESETAVVSKLYPFGHIKRYGAKVDNTTDDTLAWQTAVNQVAAVSVSNGGTVKMPSGQSLVSAQIVVPQYVRICGCGMRASTVINSYAGFAFKVGTTSATDLAYGCAIRDLAIICSNAAGGGVWSIGTAGFELTNVYIEGSSSSAAAVYVDGGNISNIFSQFTNVITNHFKFGLHIGTSGSVVPTSLTAVNFNAFCDLISGGIGIQIDALCGNGNRFFGGNLEHCATAISATGGLTQFTGVRFEGNTVDVLFPTSTSGQGTSLVSCVGLANVVNNAGVGYNNQQFIACSKADGTPWPNRIVGPTAVSSLAATDVPLDIEGASGQSGDYWRVRASDGSTVAGLDASGNLNLPVGTIKPASFSAGIASMSNPGPVSIANGATASVPGSYALVWIARGSTGQTALIAVTGVGSYVVAQNASEFSVTSGTAGTTNVFTSGGMITVENKTGSPEGYYVLTFKLI